VTLTRVLVACPFATPVLAAVSHQPPTARTRARDLGHVDDRFSRGALIDGDPLASQGRPGIVLVDGGVLCRVPGPYRDWSAHTSVSQSDPDGNGIVREAP